MKLAISKKGMDEIERAMKALNDLQTELDARALAGACMSKAAFLYANLRRMGYETPDTLADIFAFGLTSALADDGIKAKVQTENGHIVDLNAKPN